MSSGVLAFCDAARCVRRGLVCGLLAAGLLLVAGVLPAAALSITRTSGSVLYIDIPNGLSCGYVSYVISNNTSVAQSNIWVKADDFTGGIVTPAGGDSGLYHVGNLAPGEHKAVYFYVGATATTTSPQSHSIKVYQGYPEGGTLIDSQTFSLTAVQTGQNNSSKIPSVTYMPSTPTVGGTVVVTVVGDAGNVTSGDVLSFMPAAFSSWNAAALQLCDVTLELKNKNGNERTLSDYLTLPLEYTQWAGGKITYTAHYTFKAMTETSQSTPVSPMTYVTQGNGVSHPTTSGYGNLPQIQSPVNTTVLSKLADVAQVYTNEIVTYTVRFTNSGAHDVEIDRVVDTLPANMVYIPGSSKLNGVSMLDPSISGTQLVWSETELIPGSSSRDFTFQARAMSAGATTNSVVAYVGGTSTLIDTTLNTSDNVPGKAVVNVLMPPKAVDDSVSVPEDGVLNQAAPGVMGNDLGDGIAVIANTQPAHGTLALNADGSYTYTPAADYYGADSFTYTITNYNGRADTATVNVTVLPVNDAPSFTAGADQTVQVNAGAQTVPGWATNISAGPTNEGWQTLTFNVTNNNAALFSVPPAISADGTLTYTPAPGMTGTATVTVYLQDNGGTANGGVDRSVERTFTINVTGCSVSGGVFEDVNGNGVFDAEDTAGIAGVTVKLESPGGTVLATDVTDSLGGYAFTDLAPGDYVVKMVGLPGWGGSGNAHGGKGRRMAVALTGSQDKNGLDFLEARLGTIEGFVWNDTNKDGIQDAGETGIADVDVKLYSVSGETTNLVGSVTTDANGSYSFPVMAGDYFLRVNAPDGYAFSKRHANGSTPETDSDFGVGEMYSGIQTVTPGSNVLNIDAGLYYAPTLSVITSFRAYVEGGCVFVAWETAAEYDTVGYWIDRLDGDVWTRINPDEPVWAEMSGASASYALADPGAAPGGSGTWRVVEIEDSGVENVYGPYTVAVDGAAADYDAWADGVDWNGAASGRDDDPDGDGLSNFEEFLAGTDPLNANSVLRITGIRPVGNGIEIRWASVAGRVYAVEHTQVLDGAWLPVKTGIVADGAESRFTLPGADGGFFRVVLIAD